MSATTFEHVTVSDIGPVLDAADLESIRSAGWPFLVWAGWLAWEGRYAESAYTAHAGQVVVEARLIEWRDLMEIRENVRAEMGRGGAA